MTIATVNAITQALNTSFNASPGTPIPPATPSQIELDKFNQLMFSSDKKTPEQGVINAIQDYRKSIVDNVSSVTQITPENLSVESMLASQRELLNTSVTIDFGAKVAGQLSQAINKLVSMQ